MPQIRALVVDDATFMRRLLTEVLQTDAGIEVVGSAHDGEAALNAIRTLRPDVVTFDLEMPGLDGFAALARISTLWPRLPVIVVSGADLQGSRSAQLAVAAGAADYVTKPSGQTGIGEAFSYFRATLLPRIHQLTAALQHRHVLVADDGAVNRAILSRMLQSLHCTVVEASDGEEAVARARASSPELIFMDSEMPRVAGCEATRQIRQRESETQSRSFIVGISAADSAEVRTACLSSGMDDFMFKPFQLNFVRLMVNRCSTLPMSAVA